MRTRPVLRIVGAACLLGAAAHFAACLSPTQVTLVLATDVDCAAATRFGASIYGPAGDPVTVTRACTGRAPAGGDIGTFVVTPSADKNARLSVRAVLGVSRPSEDCAAANYVGCIVARRSFRFAKHESLVLPMPLERSCLDIPCDEETSCARGRCLPAAVDDARFCVGDACGAPVPSEIVVGAIDKVFTPSVGVTGFRGLAIDDVNLWATTRLATDAGQIERYDLTDIGIADGGARDQFKPLNITLSGVASFPDGSFAVYAVDSPGPLNYGFYSPTSGGTRRLPSPYESPAMGVAHVGTSPNRDDAFVIALVDGRIVTLRGQGLALDAKERATGFIEGASGTLAWPAPAHVREMRELDAGTSRDAGALPADFGEGHGFAISSNMFYVGNRAGRVIAISRVNGTARDVFPTGRWSNLADLAIRARAGKANELELFLATDDGVWRATLTER